MKYLSNYELYLKRRHCYNLVLIYDSRMCFAKLWPFYLRHQQCYISGMHPGYVQWKKNTGFTQTSCSLYIRVITKLPNSEQSYKGKDKTHNYINTQNQSLYLISIYFDYLLGLNKIPCLLYEQLFIYTTILFKRK